MRKFVKLLSLILALSMCVCVFTACDSKVDLDEPEETVDSEEEAVISVVEDFMDAMAKGDIDKAAESCYGEEMERELERNDGAWEGMEYEIKEVEVKGDENEARVVVEITLDGYTDTESIKLGKIDGEWFIGDL